MKKKNKRPYLTYSSEEREFILKNKFNLTALEMSNILGRNLDSLRHYCKRNNLDYLKVKQKHRIDLTSREIKVCELLTLGLQDQEICNQLFISLSTLKTHINNIYSKLGITGNQKGTMRLKVALHYIKNYATEEFIQELRGK